MYLLYADESGDLTNPSDSVLVVGGIAVHEDAIRPLAGEVNQTIKNFVGKRGRDIELHGSPMRSGRGEWQGFSAGKRHGLAHALMELICTWKHKASGSEVQTFVVAMERTFSQSPVETAYAEMLYEFDKYLRIGRRQGDKHNGVLVADRGKYQRALEAWVEVARARYRRPQQDDRRLYALAETPFFVDSKSTRLMQLADLVAHAFYRAYNGDDWRWANTLLPAVEDPDKRLLHFTKADCSCPACPGQPVDASAAEPVVG